MLGVFDLCARRGACGTDVIGSAAGALAVLLRDKSVVVTFTTAVGEVLAQAVLEIEEEALNRRPARPCVCW